MAAIGAWKMEAMAPAEAQAIERRTDARLEACRSAFSAATEARAQMLEAAAEELARMEALVEGAMQAGAYGLSDGLDAAWPGHFANTG